MIKILKILKANINLAINTITKIVKIDDSDKHRPNSPDGVGKLPRDPQKALDDSFDVKEAKQGVSAQDGKVVILQKSGNELYHVYIVENIVRLSHQIRKALVANRYIKHITSKKLI